ncbi:TPA: DUF4352 domain-containing protein [Streptococcus suis]|uniref:DUF4352 domain-containing protein n=1 Tax=Streptococcus suis TaxID=1307 RepID=UPI000CF448F7
MKRTITLLSAVALTGLLLTACSSNEATKTSSAPEVTETSSSSTEQTSFKIGDTLTFDGEANITITGVSYTDERNEFAEVDPLKVIVVSYNVENLSDKDYVIGSEISLYVNGKKMESYPVATTLDTISAGRTFEGASQAFAITEEGEYELEVVPSLSFTAKPAIVPFTIE